MSGVSQHVELSIWSFTGKYMAWINKMRSLSFNVYALPYSRSPAVCLRVFLCVNPLPLSPAGVQVNPTAKP